MGTLCCHPIRRDKSSPQTFLNKGLVKSESLRPSLIHHSLSCNYPGSVPLVTHSQLSSNENIISRELPRYRPISVATSVYRRGSDRGDPVDGSISPLDCQFYQFMDFPFLTSVSVIHWMMSSKIMFILRGPSGSGKTTIVDCLTEKFPNAIVCSLDNFFKYHDGTLDYDGSLLNEAEDFCQNEVYHWVDSGKSPLIIDNAHIHCGDYKYYVEVAEKFDYLVMIVVPKTPWRFDLKQLYEMSPRAEPIWEIEKSVNEFETAIPLYFGWFLNDSHSDYILQLATGMLDLFMGFREVRLDLAAACDLPEFVSKEDLVDNWTIKTDRLHVTTKYCRYGTIQGSESYSKSGAVQEGLGQLFPIHIKGLLLTPRTFSCHIQLAGPKQIQLWAGDDQEDVMTTFNKTYSKSASLKRMSSQAKPSGTKTPRRPFGCRAHMTLMHSEDVKPMQSGLDQLQIIDLQLKNEKNSFFAEVESGTITGWGLGRYYLELNFPIICPGLFTGHY